MLIDLLLLLLVLLVQDEQPPECECECTCGRKYRVSGTYTTDKDQVRGVVRALDDEIKVLEEQEGSTFREDDEAKGKEHEQQCEEYKGQGQGDESAQEVPSYNGGWGNWVEDSALTIQREEQQPKDEKRIWEGRPLPPHFDRSSNAFDAFRSSNLTLGGKRKRNEESWCSLCSKKFSSVTALQQHNSVLHDFASGPSNAMSAPKSRSASPVNSTTSMTASICEVCFEEYDTNYALRRHKTDKHPWSMLCGECLVTFNHAQDARDHYELVHGTTNIDFRRTQRMLDTLKEATPPPPVPITVTYKSHVVHSSYGCTECGMVFGHPAELAAHVSSPFSHGGAHLTAEDFPPLSTSINATVDTDLEISQVSSDRGTTILERVPNAWDDTSMPSFILAERELPVEKEEVEPLAKLTPDVTDDSDDSDDDAGSVSTGKACSKTHFNEVETSSEGGEANDNQEATSPVAAGPANANENINDSLVGRGTANRPSDPPEVTAGQLPCERFVERKGENQRTTGQVRVNADPSSSEAVEAESSTRPNNIGVSTVAPVLDLEETAPEVAMTVKSEMSLTGLVLDDTTDRPHIDLIPLNIKSPYVRAALSSATGHSAGTPISNSKPQDKKEASSPPTSEPVVVDGIECQIPSFTMLDSSPVKTKISLSPSRPSLALTPNTSNALSTIGLKSPQFEPLTLVDIAAGEGEVVDDWSASERVEYDTSCSAPKRSIISLDLTAPQNGNRPLSKGAREKREKILAKNGNGGGGGVRGGGGRKTFLTSTQRDAASHHKYGYPHSATSKRKDEEKSPQTEGGQQPFYNDGWTTLDPTRTKSTATSESGGKKRGRGGMTKPELSIWDKSRIKFEERNKRMTSIVVDGDGEDPYGGW
ncbi:hypothetical protein CI109_106869 [Kwoniella shandongensis]|uniref:Uncharacterized protein n=1 Tax=Kwoniella shandongensis TaxID=1734106 RepID=A0A5M6CB91_9TREE|nr:uncharacterized protein CI109_000875 [Kwoniella shandongensis]KAA5530695.1 hypothetical protein CI109_000875 [Kwoniella shandongensis]